MAIVNSIMATLHHLCAFVLTACLIFEFVAYRKGLSVEEARRIQRVDLVYGISAGLLIAIGLLRVFFFEKGSNFLFQQLYFLDEDGIVHHRRVAFNLPHRSIYQMEFCPV